MCRCLKISCVKVKMLLTKPKYGGGDSGKKIRKDGGGRGFISS